MKFPPAQKGPNEAKVEAPDKDGQQNQKEGQQHHPVDVAEREVSLVFLLFIVLLRLLGFQVRVEDQKESCEEDYYEEEAGILRKNLDKLPSANLLLLNIQFVVVLTYLAINPLVLYDSGSHAI